MPGRGAIIKTGAAFIAAASTLVALPAAAQDGPPDSGQDLGEAASDPTASLTAYVFQDFYTPRYHGPGNGDGNRLQFRMAVPYRLGGASNIFRVTLPYVTENRTGGNGLSDVTVFNLTTFDRRWGRFGIGAVALVPSGDDEVSAERWAIGPAAGFVAQADWGIWGIFNQNVIDAGGDSGRPEVNASILQPIFSVSLGGGWSIGASDMSITYDWEAGEFASLPLGAQLNRLVTFGRTPVQFGLSYEYNFEDSGAGPEDTIGFTMKILSPA